MSTPEASSSDSSEPETERDDEAFGNGAFGDGNRLPDTVRTVELGGRTLHLVGTAHVSPKSVEDVERTLDLVEPDTVAVELCAARHQTLTDRENWRKLDIYQVLREGKAALLLSSLVMSGFQRRIAESLGVEPGAEMMAAVNWAGVQDRRLELVDRDIQTTLKRTWGRLGLWSKMKTLFQMVGGLFVAGDIDEQTIEELKEEGALEGMLEGMARALPTVKETLIDERDLYMAQKFRETEGETVVAVVGAGHVPGLVTALEEDRDLAPLETIPRPSWLPRLLKWGIPLAIIALIAYGFYRGGAEQSLDSIVIWFLVNGSLAALGSALALGHPITVISAFLAAPLTSLNPMVAAGWVAGLVQAWVKKPTVQDLEDLPTAITTVRGFWKNPVSRVLLVVILANLGSTLGTLIGGSWIAANTL